jgi:hypothetical protein
MENSLGAVRKSIRLVFGTGSKMQSVTCTPDLEGVWIIVRPGGEQNLVLVEQLHGGVMPKLIGVTRDAFGLCLPRLVVEQATSPRYLSHPS